MHRYVRPTIGRLAGTIVAMDMHDAQRMQDSGAGVVLSQEETLAHELSLQEVGEQEIEKVTDAVESVAAPVPMAEPKKKRGRPPKAK